MINGAQVTQPARTTIAMARVIIASGPYNFKSAYRIIIVQLHTCLNTEPKLLRSSLHNMLPSRPSWSRAGRAQTFLMDQMPLLPGAWSAPQNGTFGEADSCHDDAAAGCPPEFAFPVNAQGVGPGGALKGKICYQTKAEAAAGTGPCGSW